MQDMIIGALLVSLQVCVFLQTLTLNWKFYDTLL